MYCPVGDHRDRGMEGTIIVGGGGGGTTTDETTTDDDDSGYRTSRLAAAPLGDARERHRAMPPGSNSSLNRAR